MSNACDKDKLPYCKACYAKNFGPKGIGFGNTMGDTGVGTTANSPTVVGGTTSALPPFSAPVPMDAARAVFDNSGSSPPPFPFVPPKKVQNYPATIRFAGSPKCKLCGKSAYANESVNAIGAVWHKTCFACQIPTCKKGMGGDPSSACDKDGIPFCKACYGKNFGPKGIGFGGAMGDTGIAKME